MHEKISNQVNRIIELMDSQLKGGYGKIPKFLIGDQAEFKNLINCPDIPDSQIGTAYYLGEIHTIFMVESHLNENFDFGVFPFVYLHESGHGYAANNGLGRKALLNKMIKEGVSLPEANFVTKSLSEGYAQTFAFDMIEKNTEEFTFAENAYANFRKERMTSHLPKPKNWLSSFYILSQIDFVEPDTTSKKTELVSHEYFQIWGYNYIQNQIAEGYEPLKTISNPPKKAVDLIL